MTEDGSRLGLRSDADESGEAALVLIVKMPAAATVELAGHAGFDFVLIDTEHGPNDMTEIENHVRAAESAGIRALVRVSDVRSPDILRALDAGADGIVVPHVSSADDVHAAAALIRYPPTGRRSLAMSTRAAQHGVAAVVDHLEASRRKVLIAQLEDAVALDHLPEILDTPGLAGIFIGPADLSASLGWPGQTDHPAVADAIERIANAVLRRRELVLCALAADEEVAEQWMDRGARMIVMNAPSLMAERLITISGRLKRAIPELQGS